jgi:hypothetical protein
MSAAKVATAANRRLLLALVVLGGALFIGSILFIVSRAH